jgi:hypothetical protein
MSDPGGHFFHDLIEGVVIWEDGAKTTATPIEVPAEAESISEGHVGHHDADALQDAPEHANPPGVEPHPTHAGENDVTIAAADHSHDATAGEAAPADGSHDGETVG